MTYTAKAHIEDGQVFCASTNCEGCDFEFFNKCVEVEIIDVNITGKEIIEAKDKLKSTVV